VAPGGSLKVYSESVSEFINVENPIVISVNFDYGMEDYIFFANKKRYKEYTGKNLNCKVIIASNVESKDGTEMLVDYSTLVERGGKNFDNATIMLLRLLKDMEMSEVYLAGFDGFDNESRNFIQDDFEENRRYRDAKKLNIEISNMFSKLRDEYSRRNIEIMFITESIYDVYR
jgi:4-hydroxy 2-oxovalerate aldolase